MWYSNDMFHYMLKAEFVTLVSLKVPSGNFAANFKYMSDSTTSVNLWQLTTNFSISLVYVQHVHQNTEYFFSLM